MIGESSHVTHIKPDPGFKVINLSNDEIRHPKRNVLIAVLGRTPQILKILTETIYALRVTRHIPITEVLVISTQEGYQETMKKLLALPDGKFYCLHADYPREYGQVNFTPQHIIVAQDEFSPVSDIRTRQQSEKFLELIMHPLYSFENKIPGAPIYWERLNPNEFGPPFFELRTLHW